MDLCPGRQLPSLRQILTARRSVLDELLRQLQSPDAAGPLPGNVRVQRDADTGQTFLKIPAPSQAFLGRAGIWLQAMASVLAGGSQK